MVVTPEQLQRIMPHIGPRLTAVIAPINAAMERFQINTPRRVSEFLGQIAHESAQMAALRENLNYGIGALRRTWPRRFPDDATAQQYAYQPEKLGNHVYANLYGNGDEASGEGFHYRGAGYLQHTFKANHAAIGTVFDMPVEQVGDWLATHEGASLAAAWWWNEHGCNRLADAGDTDAISDIINLGHRTIAVGDAIGYSDRLAFRNAGRTALGIA